MRGQTFQALGIPPFRIGKTVPTEALKAMLALQGEIDRLRDERAATPEEARRANVALRRLMRTQNNTSPSSRSRRARILAAVDHPGGPLTQRTASDIAAHLGFTLHYVPDLPQTTRSVADIKNGRLYLSSRLASKGDPRTAVLQALSSRILGHTRADELRRVPPPARGDELPDRGAADPRGARGAVPAGGQGTTGRSRSKTCATRTRCRTRRRRTASRISRPCISASRCTSSRCTSRARSRRPTRTTT